jgi:excisionase family DNA binding protein
MDRQKEFLTRAEAAELLGLGTQTLSNWAWKGEGVPFVKLNKRCVRYHRDTILKWAEQRMTHPGQQTV